MNNHGDDGISNENSSLLHNNNGHHLSLETPTSTKHTGEVEVVEVEDIQKEVQTLDPKDMIINATHHVMIRPFKN